jgi:serine/threonine-protein kinase SRPK3
MSLKYGPDWVTRYSAELFNRKGELRNIRRLKFWDIPAVLVDKVEFRMKCVSV